MGGDEDEERMGKGRSCTVGGGGGGSIFKK
jgi:hypothetical protein